LEDQILHADSMEEVLSDGNPYKMLLKKEQRFIVRLQEEQEAEAEALERFQRAQKRLERRRKRVERIQGKLALVREQLAMLQITEQQTEYIEHEVVTVATSESTPGVDSDEVILAQPEQENVAAHESDGSSSSYPEQSIPDTSESEQESTFISTVVSEVLAGDSAEERGKEQEHTAPQQITTSPAPFIYEPIKTIVESEHEVAQELETSSPSAIESTIPTTFEQEPIFAIDSITTAPEAEVRDGVEISSETNIECNPTKPLRLEHAGLPAAESLSSKVQSAKEAWIAAESDMQNARNTAYGIATSISFLSQNDGLSSELMEELVRTQADANKDLLRAQDVARAAYERFVHVQRDSESSASPTVGSSMDLSKEQLQQGHTSLPPAEDNGADQTAKLHAIRLYKEW
jgi:hypothetical protein